MTGRCPIGIDLPMGAADRVDDETEGGRITRLARDVVSQFEMLTGESIELFLDRDSVEWGDEWWNKVDVGLASVAFFIPVITPRYFRSPECRRELQFFARQATALGVRELVMPLLYVDFPALHEEHAADNLIALVKGFQWEDWTDLRLADPTSAEYRTGVAKLAQRLVMANVRAEHADLSTVVQALISVPGEGEEEPGFLDRIAGTEETMPKWSETLERIGEQINAIGVIMEHAGAQMSQGDKQGKGFAART